MLDPTVHVRRRTQVSMKRTWALAQRDDRDDSNSRVSVMHNPHATAVER